MKFQLDFDIAQSHPLRPTDEEVSIIEKILEEIGELPEANEIAIAINNAPTDRIRSFIAVHAGLSLAAMAKEDFGTIIFSSLLAERTVLSYYGFSFNQLLEKLENNDSKDITDVAETKGEFFCLLYLNAFLKG